MYSCRMPDGAAAPVDGWSGSVAAGGAYDDYVVDTCGSGGGLVAALGTETRHLAYADRATWTFSAPGYATLVGADVWRAGYVHGNAGEEASYELWLAGPLLKNVFDECVYTLNCRTIGEPSEKAADVNRVTVPAKNLGDHLLVSAACGAGIEGSECDSGLGTPTTTQPPSTSTRPTSPSNRPPDRPPPPSPANSRRPPNPRNRRPDVHRVGPRLRRLPGARHRRRPPPPVHGSRRSRRAVPRRRPDNGRATRLPLPRPLPLVGLRRRPGRPLLARARRPSPRRRRHGRRRQRRPRSRPHDRHPIALGCAGPALPAPASGATGSQAAQSAAGAPNGTTAASPALLSARWQSTPSSRLTVSYGHRETITGRLTSTAGAPIAGAQIAILSTPPSPAPPPPPRKARRRRATAPSRSTSRLASHPARSASPTPLVPANLLPPRAARSNSPSAPRRR